ncbi:MAG: TetR/AcrR family transcriptional regulator [Hydrogenophaga sp.]|uniref:TetR/AcrR family transcriptional regulator n=1 Tax=Hydrogenophaga sp. TaxID=1904254 RepID=UPI0025BCDDFF|nr:TetR/AcrR family transcriptional regulator [Hydrogenophaga sp.]MDO8889912.1 TetR/AcrR family transcriptional regulator [Hydrogenophaga sp.]MDO9507079.1 TetR/AcrR family transcriptional regulator [Hydrogenophaga sp.]MDP1782302.1 TetR/AcrR family transcriptional regulator [Hydrogenophaga sp.]MDP2074652.1 TetR/AcrR family transcriptional regulator [Hydrogenophaga sp.]MDP2251231.1 TetR/AcrR family transcriptional regulator [Hydrogenophaga sp.]
MRIQTNPDKAIEAAEPEPEAPARRRMGVVERERQILDGAIQFFSVHGFNGQLRDLAKSIGVTHALLYHYFPTKQALVDRVYLEVFEGRWRAEWDALLDDPDMAVEDKLTAFYWEYVTITLTREFVRILVFSGLTDHTITDRFFAMLRTRLFPRLIRETRRFRGVVSRAKPSEREIELLMGLHGGFFYITMRRWIYAQDVYSEVAHEGYDEQLVRDRVRAYLNASRDLFADTTGSPRKRAATR